MTKKEKKLLSATAKITSAEHEPLKVEFAPGCFDHIDVESQEELDRIMKNIQEMFANMTAEELKAKSEPIDWDNLDEQERAILEQAFSDDTFNTKRKLQ